MAHIMIEIFIETAEQPATASEAAADASFYAEDIKRYVISNGGKVLEQHGTAMIKNDNDTWIPWIGTIHKGA